MNTQRFLPAPVIIATAGCAVTPNYNRPEIRVPEQWTQTAATQPAELATQPADISPPPQPVNLTTWWESFNDPTLNDLIHRAGESNLDLRIAAARVVEARALRDIAAADYYPQFNFDAGYTYRGSSLNASRPQRSNNPSVLSRFGNALAAGATRAVRNAITGDTGTGSSVSGTAARAASGVSVNFTRRPVRDLSLFQAGFDAAWEFDVWGRIRRSVEAAEADLATLEEDRANVLITLLSDVALNYVQLRGFQRRLEIAEKNIADQRETLELNEELLRGGFASELEVSQARALVETTRSVVPELQSAARQSIYQLSVLLGQTPDLLLAELSPAGQIPGSVPDVPLGLPSDLLRRRPDIRAAERAVAAATARVGVAVAEMFPTFSLTGNFGVQTSRIKHFLDENSFSWAVGPGFTWPIFQGGRLRANVRAENARQEQALAGYAQIVLIALQEVENALVAFNQERVRHDTLIRAVQANQDSTEISIARWRGGFTPYLNVLEAQRALYLTQDQLIQSETTTIANLIALYKALGGGWEWPETDVQ